MKIRIFILIIGISFLQIPILFAQECYTIPVEECADYWYCQSEGNVCAGYDALILSGDLDLIADNRWSLVINSINTDVATNEGNNSFHLGMCSECSDGFNAWEESDNISPQFNPFIDLYFSYENGTEYNTDYKSIHSPDQLVIWDIAANIYGVDVVQLKWDFDDFLPPEYEIYLFDGDTGYNMRADSTLSLSMEAFYLNGNETNIKLRIGACAETGYTTHYFDNDFDGLGGEQSNDFCLGFAPDGWVLNNDDEDDNCFSNIHDCAYVCDGEAVIQTYWNDVDGDGLGYGIEQEFCSANVPDGWVLNNYDEDDNCSSNLIDQCGVCDGNGIPDGECDCNGNIDDCAGVCGGTSTLETLCEDTDGDGLGNPGSETVQCIDLGGDILIGCDLPDLHLYLSSDGSVFYNSSEPINGFQFDVEGASVLGASGGDTGAADFMISSNSTTVIAFSATGNTIEGCGTLVDLELDGEATGLNNIVVSDSLANPIPFFYYQEDEIDLVLDCSDEFPDCSYNFYDCFDYCGGSAEIDECGVCGGDGPVDGYNCNGTPELFIHYFNGVPQAFYFFNTVTINGDNVDLDDWVGAFNGDICVGARQWDTLLCAGGICEVPVMGDDGNDLTQGYMVTGDIPTFKIFDASENEYYSATPSEDIPWANNAINELDSLQAISVLDYCIELHFGANLISFFALPEDVSVQSVMSPLGENISGVITEGGACSQIAPGNWVGSQCSLSPEKGYWVILNSEIDLCLIDAYFTDPAILYDLHSGANLISFPSEFSVSVSDAFPDDIEGAIIGVITESGACSQLSPGNWVGSHCSFNGGMGYWVITTKSAAFTYDLSTLGRIKSNNSFGLTFPNGFEVRQSSLQAFYFIENLNLGNETSNDGWIISYYHGKVTGSRQWTGELIDIPVMGNDGNSYSQGYLHTGETPQFKYLDNTTGKLTDLYHGDVPEWENNGIYILGSMDVLEILPQGIMLNAYPNPFNPVTTLSFTVANEGLLQLSIYNISGQLVSELAHEYRTPGNVEYNWDAGNHPSGVYFAQLNINGIYYTQKLVLMK